MTIQILVMLCAVALIYMIVQEMNDIKHMTIEEAKAIAIDEETHQSTCSVKKYIKARSILLDNGYWVWNDKVGTLGNMLSCGDYIKDFETGELIVKNETIKLIPKMKCSTKGCNRDATMEFTMPDENTPCAALCDECIMGMGMFAPEFRPVNRPGYNPPPIGATKPEPPPKPPKG